MQASAPRKIVILSDGTGNSSISPTKTNVWRIYQALDLGPNKQGQYSQIAFYDDGVGSSGFKLIRVLSGAFGWGLSRNVRQLYENLCRHYEPGDKIYIFGFSRGAFTVRVLAYFISCCGILDRNRMAPNSKWLRMDTDKGLRKGVRHAYKSYRRGYWDNASLFLQLVSKALRKIRNLLSALHVSAPEEFKSEYALTNPNGEEPLIEFIGVWDTVEAIGLPVEELTAFLDIAVYPYKFPNQKLPPEVRRTCHCLAIDDERQTFHPVLWDERDEADPSKIKQVWFAGMHSSVGGSYPEDNLAYISLDWIIGEVSDKSGRNGLVFNSDELDAIRQKAHPLGKMYDSRRGFGVYYRYMPRSIERLCHMNCKHDRWMGDKQAVCITDVKIHHSVLDRIADTKVGYAPTGLPEKFLVVDNDGRIFEPTQDSPYFESPGNRKTRTKHLERAKNHIFWRRVTYFFLLALTLCLIFLPQFSAPIPGVEPRNEAELPQWIWDWLPHWFSAGLFWSLVYLERFYVWAVELISGYLPSFSYHWLDAWAQSPAIFTLLILMVIVFYQWSSVVTSRIQRHTEAAWWHMKGYSDDHRFTGGPFIFERFAAWLQCKGWYHSFRRIFSRILVPAFFIVCCFAFSSGLAYRIFIYGTEVREGVCTKSQSTQQKEVVRQTVGENVLINFDPRVPCFDTGFTIEPGRKYNVSIVEEEPWFDLDTPIDIGGISNRFKNLKPSFLFGLPSRRNLTKPWFVLLGEIDAGSGHVIPFNRNNFTFIARNRGTLYLYVNDGINAHGALIPQRQDTPPSNSWDAYYANNSGSSTIRISAEQ